MKRIKKYQGEIILGTVVLSVIAGLILYIAPAISAIFLMRDEIESVRAANDKLAQKLQAVDSLDLADFERNYRLVNLVLLKDKKPASVFSFFDHVLAQGEAINISLGALNFSPGEMKNTKTETQESDNNLEFDVPVKGKYEDAYKFVDAAEKSYPLVSITSLSGDIGEAADIKLGLKMYVYPERYIVPSLDSSISPLSDIDRRLIDEIRANPSISEDTFPPPQKFDRTNLFE